MSEESTRDLDARIWKHGIRIEMLEAAHAALALRVLNRLAAIAGMSDTDIRDNLQSHARDVRSIARALGWDPDASILVQRIDDAAERLDHSPQALRPELAASKV